jgi:hypothetical protein
MSVSAWKETPYGITVNMPLRFDVALFFLDSRRVKGDNMAKLVIMGDLLINQGAFYAGR